MLWEHLKYKVTITKTADGKDKQNKGNIERQDAYLYGHPQGRKKRYRSPADFLPHLLWLCTDEEGDFRNCSCKLCSPAEGDEEQAEDGKQDIKADAQPRIESKSEPMVIINSRPTAAAGPASAPKPPPAATPRTAAPSTQSLEQQFDSQAGSPYLYRPGELVWWENDPSNNWRLGVISRRGLINNKPRYLVQPLSNPLQVQPHRIKDKESSLRPWLAWSLPETTIPLLQHKHYDEIPWDRVVRGEFDQGQPGREYVVDGSILAARVIDASYSLFERNERALAGPGEVHYNGMFLGGEKVWVGEPVRIKAPSVSGHMPEIVVLIISKLIERTTGAASAVTVIGDVYKWVEMPTPYRSRAEWPTPQLPPRMVSDLRFRNEVADMAKTGIWYEWRLLEPQAKKTLSEIKGRWYETQALLPILSGEQKFRQDAAAGKLLDANEWMNSRRDNNIVAEQRRKNRADTFGRAVPGDFKVSRGLDGEPAEDLFPDQMQPGLQGQQYINQSGGGQAFYGSAMQH